MTMTVFLAVLSAAFLHAGWNALVKGGRDPAVNMAAVILGHVPFAVLAILVSPLPDPASYPYIAGGVALHVGYQIFLLQSYRFGDLTQVYPIARGSAPLIVAAISVVFLGVRLSPAEMLGVAVIGAGIISLGLVRQRDGLHNHRAATLALITGCFIAGYSLVDGWGARLAGTSLGFYGWLSIGNGLVFACIMRVVNPGALRRVPVTGKTAFVLGGGASFTAFALVVWAFTQAPIPLVTALRETSIVFALLIGVFFLGERLNLAKVLSTAMTILGAVILRLAR